MSALNSENEITRRVAERIQALGYMEDIRLTPENTGPKHAGNEIYYLVGNNLSRIVFERWGKKQDVSVHIRDTINHDWQEVLRLPANDFITAPLLVEIASDVPETMRQLAMKMTSTTKEKDGAWFSMEIPARSEKRQQISLVTEGRLYRLDLVFNSGRNGRLLYRDRWSLSLDDKDAVDKFHFSDIVRADAEYEARLQAEREKMRREFEEMSKPGPVSRWVKKQVDRVRRVFRGGGPRPKV